MPAIGTLTETLDNLYTSTWQNMKSEIADNIFDATPFWFWLKDKGKFKTEEGGRFLTEPLQYFKDDNLQWVGKGSTVSLRDMEFLTIAKYDWRYLAGSIVRFGVDDQQNRGKNQILSLMNAKMENLQNALISEMEAMLFAASGAVTGAGTLVTNPRPDGLQVLVADDPTTSTYQPGGIDPSVYTWWRNQTVNMTGKSFAAFGVAYMRTLLNNCGNNLKSDFPDIIVSGQTPYEYYEDTVLIPYRISNNKLGDMGFQNIEYKGIPMIWSPSCANTRMYMLNTRFISFVYDPVMYFDMTEWKAIPNQLNDRAAQVMLACSTTVSRRRCQGVLFNIDTP